MALTLIVDCLCQISQNADAALLFSQQASMNAPLPQDCVCPNTRSIWDLIWSCLVTIFACSWVSVHPNILAPDERGWKRLLQRLELMFWSIITPELIIYWASGQWYAARVLAKKYNEYGWTTTHGYFIQMGGFMLYDGENEVGVLVPEHLESLLQDKRVAMPKITEREIKDRSKGDGLSKALVVTQTTWFIVQCIARVIEGLVITELELVTLAFAALNVVMYTFWWNKPLSVTTIVRVDLLQGTAAQNQILAGTDDRESFSASANYAWDMLSAGEPRDSEDGDIEVREHISLPEMQTPRRRAFNVQHLSRQARWIISGILFHWPVAGITSVIRRMGNMTDPDVTEVNPEGKIRLNIFYAHNPNPEKATLTVYRLFILLTLVGTLFGAIHCAGWHFSFPTVIELNVWRISAAIIIGVPTIGLIFGLLAVFDYYYPSILPVEAAYRPVILLGTGMLPIYFLARLALLVEALISLRNLPDTALQVVEWSSLVPHV